MKSSSSWDIYKRVLSYTKPYTRRIVAALGCMVLVSCCAVVPPWLMKNVVDDVLIRKDIVMLNLVAVSLVAVYLIKGVASYGQKYLMTWVGQKVVLDLRVQAYAAAQSMSLKYINGRRVGELISRVTNDATVLQTTVTNAVVDLVVQGITTVGMLGFLLYINWRLTVVTFGVFPLTVWVIDKASKKLRIVGRQVQENLAGLSALTEEALSAIRIVRAFATEAAELRRFQDQSRSHFKALMKGTQVNSVLSGAVELLLIVALAIIFWIGGRSVVDGVMTPGDLIAFLGYLGFMAHPVTVLSRVVSQIQHGLAAAERIFDLVDNRDRVTSPKNPVVLRSIRGSVDFRNVWFRYDDTWVLQGISLSVAPGETVALVGATGSGKSTLVDLIQRFYDPERGTVAVDNHDVRSLDLGVLRRQIGVVPQDPVLMKGSFKFNISYGMDGASDYDVRKAAEIAGIARFIEGLPQGYESEIGERGVTLSGGQRQRVAIARAVIRDPRILIMDEATSSLDVQVEQAIQRAMDRAMEGRTAFVIAHRLSTIRGADRILYLDNGVIAEEGVHEELIRSGGLYSRLHAIQQGGLS
ncbi:MAG: ABC transporter permease [Dethiosulfovibrio peptidovorans]|nr:MAG: ABC transporter permease [Dethiosulfovibrio peptidovorans]